MKNLKWLMRISVSAKRDFNLALKRLAKIRYYDSFCVGDREFKTVKVPPKHIGLCKPSTCNAGMDCCHQEIVRKITFCVY